MMKVILVGVDPAPPCVAVPLRDEHHNALSLGEFMASSCRQLAEVLVQDEDGASAEDDFWVRFSTTQTDTRTTMALDEGYEQMLRATVSWIVTAEKVDESATPEESVAKVALSAKRRRVSRDQVWGAAGTKFSLSVPFRTRTVERRPVLDDFDYVRFGEHQPERNEKEWHKTSGPVQTMQLNGLIQTGLKEACPVLPDHVDITSVFVKQRGLRDYCTQGKYAERGQPWFNDLVSRNFQEKTFFAFTLTLPCGSPDADNFFDSLLRTEQCLLLRFFLPQKAHIMLVPTTTKESPRVFEATFIDASAYYSAVVLKQCGAHAHAEPSAKHNPKPFLLLDIDETFLHTCCETKAPPGFIDGAHPYDGERATRIDQSTLYFRMRPNAGRLIRRLGDRYNIFFFTAGHLKYGQWLVHHLAKNCWKEPHGSEDAKWFQDNAGFERVFSSANQPGHMKSLGYVLPFAGWDVMDEQNEVGWDVQNEAANVHSRNMEIQRSHQFTVVVDNSRRHWFEEDYEMIFKPSDFMGQSQGNVLNQVVSILENAHTTWAGKNKDAVIAEKAEQMRKTGEGAWHWPIRLAFPDPEVYPMAPPLPK